VVIFQLVYEALPSCSVSPSSEFDLPSSVIQDFTLESLAWWFIPPSGRKIFLPPQLIGAQPGSLSSSTGLDYEFDYIFEARSFTLVQINVLKLE
jgi:hypothetical protein